MKKQCSYTLEKIIKVANELANTGCTGASTSEQIAAAFVLNRMDLLPNGYTMVEAWERLGDWQDLVKTIQSDYQDLLVPWQAQGASRPFCFYLRNARRGIFFSKGGWHWGKSAVSC